MIKYDLKWIKLKWQQYYQRLSYWCMAILSTISDQLLSVVSINDMIIEVLLSPFRIYYHFSSSILQLLLLNILLQMVLLSYANGKTDIPIINAVNDSGNAISDTDSLLSSLLDDTFHVREPIKNIIGGNIIDLFYFLIFKFK